VVTADQGEALGEWMKYGHSAAFPYPAMKRVSWVEMTAVDEHTHEPQSHTRANGDENQCIATDRFRDLGYTQRYLRDPNLILH